MTHDPPPCVPIWCTTNAARSEAVVAKALRTLDGRIVTKSCVITPDLYFGEQEACSHMKFSECGKRVTFDASKCLKSCCEHGLIDQSACDVSPGHDYDELNPEQHPPPADPPATRQLLRRTTDASTVYPGVLQNSNDHIAGAQQPLRGRRLLADRTQEERFDAAINVLV